MSATIVSGWCSICNRTGSCEHLQPKTEPRELSELDRHTEHLNARIREAEKAIRDLRLGVSAKVPMGDTGQQLMFCKQSGAWTLAIEHQSTIVPLVNCTRATRLRAVNHLSELVEAMRASIAGEVAEVRSAATKVDSFLKSIGFMPSSEDSK